MGLVRATFAHELPACDPSLRVVLFGGGCHGIECRAALPVSVGGFPTDELPLNLSAEDASDIHVGQSDGLRKLP